MISTNYTHSTNFSGKITPVTKERLLQRATSPEITTKLKNKFKEIEDNTNKNSVIHLSRVDEDSFVYGLISKNDGYSLTKNFKNTKIIDEFLGISVKTIKQLENILIKNYEL